MRVEIHVTAGPAKGQHFTFDKPNTFLFGRSTDAQISLPQDRYVSRQHFLLEITSSDCKLTDLNSKNGVVVNGVRYGGHNPPRKGIRQAPGPLVQNRGRVMTCRTEGLCRLGGEVLVDLEPHTEG